MAEATLTPVLHWPTGDYEEVPGSVVPPGEEHKLTARMTNTTGAEVRIRLGVGPDANTANSGPGAYDLRIPANEARDIERGLELPEGWRFFARQSGAADAVLLRITGTKLVVL